MMAAVARARHDVLAPYLKPRPSRDRLDQLADAMHDEGDLRAVPAAARDPVTGQDELRVLVLQPGPAARPRRLRGARPAPEAERRAGKTHRAMGGSCAGAAKLSRPRGPPAAAIADRKNKRTGRARLARLRFWCRRRESNSRPSHYECAALPTELRRHLLENNYLQLIPHPLVTNFVTTPQRCVVRVLGYV